MGSGNDRRIPTYDEVMSPKPQKIIPSFAEVMGEEESVKKKVPSDSELAARGLNRLKSFFGLKGGGTGGSSVSRGVPSPQDKIKAESDFIADTDAGINEGLGNFKAVKVIKGDAGGRSGGDTYLRNNLAKIDLEDASQYANVLQTLRGSTYLEGKDGKADYQLKNKLIQQLEDRLKIIVSKEGVSKTLSQLDKPIQDAALGVIMKADRGEKVPSNPADDQKKIHQFKLGLSHAEKTDPVLFTNVLRTVSRKGEVAEGDFRKLSLIGQQIENFSKFRASAHDPAWEGTETDFDYSTYGEKKAKAAADIGEQLKAKGYKNQNRFTGKQIREAATELGIENKDIVEDLVKEENILFYDAIPKSGWIDDVASGIMQPISGIRNTIQAMNESPAETYLRSQRLDEGIGGQKVPDEKGQYSDILPSERGDWKTHAFRGLGQFIPQVLLARGIGGLGTRALGTTGATLSAAQKAGMTNYLGTAVSSYIQSYGQEYEDALKRTGDPKKAQLLATIDSGFTAGWEMLLPDAKIASKSFNSVKKALGNDLAGIIKLGGNPAELAKKSRPYIQRAIGELSTIWGKEISEEVGTALTDYMTETIFSPASAKERNFGKEVGDTFKTAAAATLLPSILGGGMQGLQKEFTQSTLHSAAMNFDEYKDALDKSLQNEEISQQEYDKTVGLLQKHKANIESVTKEDEDDASEKQLDEAYKLTVEQVETEQKGIAALNKAVDDGKLTGIYAEVVKQSPELVLKDVSQQAQNLNSEGVPHNDGREEQSMQSAVDTFGKEVVYAAIKAFPAPQQSSVNKKFEYKEDYRTRDSEDGEHEVVKYIVESGGNIIGMIELHEHKDMGYRFSWVDINKEIRGKGIGADLYRGINEKSINETGKPLWSKSESISEDAKRVWESLVKKGEAIKTAEAYQFKPTEQTEAKTEQAIPEGTQQAETPQTPIPPEGIIPEAAVTEGEEGTSIIHAATEEMRKEFKLPEYERRESSFDEWDKEAAKRIREGKMPALLKKMQEGKEIDAPEQRMMGMYIAHLDQNASENPSNENISALKQALDLSDRVGGSQIGKSLVARKGTFRPDNSLGDFMIREIEESGVDNLTDSQKKQVTKEHTEITEAEKAWKEKFEALQQENAKLRAEQEVKKAAKGSIKEKKDFKKEREQIFDNIKDKLKKARQDTQVTILPYAKELIAIAPDVAKLMKSYVEQGITELGEIVKHIHDDLKPHIPDIKESDVRDIIAGDYNTQRKTQSQLAAKLRDLRKEAELVKELDRLENIEPKDDKKKAELSRRKKEIKDKLKKDLTPEEKTKLRDEIKEIEDAIKRKDYEPEPIKKPQIKLDDEAIRLKDRLIKLKQDRELRMLHLQYEKRSKWEKARDNLANVLNVPRVLMASMDYSAPLRQALIATVSHPRTAAKAALQMFKASWSQKYYDRWFDNLQETPRFQLMKDMKLAISDPHSLSLSQKEEEFMSNLVDKVPFIGKAIPLGEGIKIPFTDKKLTKIGGLVKGSERAYSMYLNKMRVDIFNQFADQMEKNGRTPQNSPEAYKQMASYVNNLTGRGDLGIFNSSAPILNGVLFSPRLIASRLNMLTYLGQKRFYTRVPPEVRRSYFKDMAATVALGVGILMLAKAMGADVEDDPRSSDFGKIKQGNTRWDIWGGFQQYARVAAQAWSGKRVSDGVEYSLKGEGAFGADRGDVLTTMLRSKLSPVGGILWDRIKGRDILGRKVTLDWENDKDKRGKETIGLKEYLIGHFLPLSLTGTAEAMKDRGIKGMFDVGVPNIFGVGVQHYESKSKKVKPNINE